MYKKADSDWLIACYASMSVATIPFFAIVPNGVFSLVFMAVVVFTVFGIISAAISRDY